MLEAAGRFVTEKDCSWRTREISEGIPERFSQMIGFDSHEACVGSCAQTYEFVRAT